jgi:purine-nucleoside phosphorylase
MAELEAISKRTQKIRRKFIRKQIRYVYLPSTDLSKTAMDYAQQILQTVDFLKSKGISTPDAGTVLGTGLGQLTSFIQAEQTLEYEEIPGWPRATVEFHTGRLIFGTIGKTKVLAMQGRFHYYEGYSMQQITLPVRVMHALGVKHLLLSNAAGGIRADLKKGDLVLLEDHINLQPDNPLRGLNTPEYGARFPDMSAPYDAGLSQKLRDAGIAEGRELKSGVYASVSGPNLETRAEYRFLRTIGADMVGMSTVPEVIVAAQLGIPTAAVSVITDECDPDNLKPVDIAEIIEVAGKADAHLSRIFVRVLEGL